MPQIKYEDLWERAKKLVDKQYNVKHGTDRYWTLVMGIYKQMERRRDFNR